MRCPSARTLTESRSAAVIVRCAAAVERRCHLTVAGAAAFKILKLSWEVSLDRVIRQGVGMRRMNQTVNDLQWNPHRGPSRGGFSRSATPSPALPGTPDLARSRARSLSQVGIHRVCGDDGPCDRVEHQPVGQEAHARRVRRAAAPPRARSRACRGAERTFEHSRTVHRVTWHPTDPEVLASASQDGTVRLMVRGRASRREASHAQAHARSPRAGRARRQVGRR